MSSGGVGTPKDTPGPTCRSPIGGRMLPFGTGAGSKPGRRDGGGGPSICGMACGGGGGAARPAAGLLASPAEAWLCGVCDGRAGVGAARAVACRFASQVAVRLRGVCAGAGRAGVGAVRPAACFVTSGGWLRGFGDG